MHPDIANERVGAAYDYVAAVVADFGTGEYAARVRELASAHEALSAAARRVRDAESLAALAEDRGGDPRGPERPASRETKAERRPVMATEEKKRELRAATVEAIIAKDTPANAPRAAQIREFARQGDDHAAIYLLLKIVEENGTFS